MWPFGTPYPEVSPSEVDGESYDYVIVGGGTAGCVLASRLSENPNVSVLVLEKGHVKDSFISRIPLASQNLAMTGPLQVKNNRWSEPMPGANGRRNRLWAVEGIGGASRVNSMLWTRGIPGDYASWSELGLDDWGWEKVEPYFRKLENAFCHPKSDARGHSGPIELRQDKHPFQWVPYMEQAVKNVGLRVMNDCNDPASPAMGYFSLDTAVYQNRYRVSALSAFLGKNVALRRRKHLIICTGVIASRLEIDAATSSVLGVHIRQSSDQGHPTPKDSFVKAEREVILCCGAMCTPQLLLLSGVGPSHSGEEAGVPLLKELPTVGTTLSDHYSFPVELELPRLMGTSSTLNTIFVRSEAIQEKTMQVKEHGDDRADNMDALKSRNVPDLEIMFIPFNTLDKPVPGRSLLTLYPTLVQPHGQGRIELVDNDPLSDPRIIYPMFTDERDLIVARRAVRFTMRLAHEFQNSGYPHPAPLAFAPGNNERLLGQWEKIPFSDGPKDTAIGLSDAGVQRTGKFNDSIHVDSSNHEMKTWQEVTDDEIDDYVKRVSNTSLHFSCTCRMSRDSRTGVVDQKLRVHGFPNLRIADTSVFPKIPSGHTMAPVMMVAERCADFIKATW